MRDFVVAFPLEGWLKIQSTITTVVVLVMPVGLAVLTAGAQPWLAALAALAAGGSLLMLWMLWRIPRVGVPTPLTR